MPFVYKRVCGICHIPIDEKEQVIHVETCRVHKIPATQYEGTGWTEIRRAHQNKGAIETIIHVQCWNNIIRKHRDDLVFTHSKFRDTYNEPTRELAGSRLDHVEDDDE